MTRDGRHLEAGDLSWGVKRVARRAILRAFGILPSEFYQELVFRLGAILSRLSSRSVPTARKIRTIADRRGDSDDTVRAIRAHSRFLLRSKLFRIIAWGLRFNRSSRWDASGLDHLDEALKEERPVMLVSVHCGHPRLILPILKAHGYPLRQVVAEGRKDLVRRVRWERWRDARPSRQRGIRGRFLRLLLEYDDIGAGLDVRPILDAFSRDQAVLIVVDGIRTSETVDVPMLGGSYPFAVGFMRIAMLEKATVLPTYVVEKDGGRRVRLEILPPFQVDDAANAAQNVTMLGRVFESHLESFPHQWYKLQRLTLAHSRED